MRITQENLACIVHDTRCALSLTQSELAYRAGCSQRLVSNLENGKGSVEFSKVMAVLEALGIGLEATPLPVADPGAEVKRLAGDVAERLAPPKERKPRLSSFLGEEK